jgi:hypothetical protein
MPSSSQSGETIYPGPLVEESDGDNTEPELDTVAIPSNGARPSVKGADPKIDPVRLPTQSEIQRAVDAVATMPIPLEMLEAPPVKRPQFEEILSRKGTGHVSSAPQIEAADAAPTVPPEAAREPTVRGQLVSRESHPTPIDPIALEREPDDTAFVPMGIGPTGFGSSSDAHGQTGSAADVRGPIDATSASPPALERPISAPLGRGASSDSYVWLLYVVGAVGALVIGLAIAVFVSHC